MIKSIIYAKKIIASQVKNRTYEQIGSNFTKYQKAFYWSNENIDCYLNMVDLKTRENALTVAGSGDHIFNLVANGITEVDSFDINYLTDYLALGLKKAMIEKYDYYEFLTMISNIANPLLSLEELSDTLTDLLPLMDMKYRIFWREIISYNYKLQKQEGTNLNLILMLYIGVFTNTFNLNNNTYLMDEYSYNEFKSNLSNSNITFRGLDVADVPNKIKGKTYDLILLSNTLDYIEGRWGQDWTYEKLETYLKSLEHLAKDNGIIFYKYVINLLHGSDYKEHIFYDSSVKLEEVKSEMHLIPKNGRETIYDGMLLRRVKIDK